MVEVNCFRSFFVFHDEILEEDSKVLRHLETDVFNGEGLCLSCTSLIPDQGDNRIDSLENLEPRNVVGKVPGLGARHLLSPPPGLLGADAGPLDLVVGHPREAFGDQGREDPAKQGRGEGGDDDGGTKNGLDGSLPVSERG